MSNLSEFSSNSGQIYNVMKGDKRAKSVCVLGLMSGTSCDGLDLALIDVDLSDWSMQWRAFTSFDYSEDLRSELRALGALSPDNSAELSAALALERRWTNGVIDTVMNALEGELQRELKGSCRPELVGFSGHTWYHELHDVLPGRTRAIGGCQQLADALGLAVVGDYRSADVAAGGRGAPLVPLFDAHVFPEFSACLNLGGIANLSAQRGRADGGQRVAWDVCGCNLLLNRQAERLGEAYDAGGVLAGAAQMDRATLEKLRRWTHLAAPPPKALSAEDLGGLHALLDALPPAIALATATEHIAEAISAALLAATAQKNGTARVLVTGGGAWNHHLLLRLERVLTEMTSRNQCDVKWSVERPEARWVEGKEAAAFAWLALRTLDGRVTSLASATGADADVCGGLIYRPI
jgi:anhydro-N-acetylmuramic acid kinase